MRHLPSPWLTILKLPRLKRERAGTGCRAPDPGPLSAAPHQGRPAPADLRTARHVAAARGILIHTIIGRVRTANHVARHTPNCCADDRAFDPVIGIRYRRAQHRARRSTAQSRLIRRHTGRNAQSERRKKNGMFHGNLSKIDLQL